MIVYRIVPDGGFVCGDTTTLVTVYAYPTSVCAEGAKNNPQMTADIMLEIETRWRQNQKWDQNRGDEYDKLNWDRLNAVAMDHIQ